MGQLKVKKEFQSEVIAFNNSGAPLGERDDVDLLADAILKNPVMRRFFDDLPSDDNLRKISEEYTSKVANDEAAKKGLPKLPLAGTVTQSTSDKTK